MNKNQTLVFFLLAIIYIISTMSGVYPLSWLVKILPLLLLIFITSKHLQGTASKLFLAGLIFSSFGDFFLAYNPKQWFIFGLGSFLIAHIFYLVSFLPIEKKRLQFVVIYVIFGAAMFSLIAPGLGNLFIPVLAYMSILLLMAITTLLSKVSNTWLMLGGLSFAISDSLLGLNKFYEAFSSAHILIMASYYLAQFALVKGMLKQKG